jgi:hypothetical protein
MSTDGDRTRIFWLSVLALFSAAFCTSLRAATAAGIKLQWIDPIASADAGRLIGEALGAPFLGFALTLFISSAFADVIGGRLMLIGSGLCGLAGGLAVLFAGTIASDIGAYHVVWWGMLLCGVSWGLAEACINPLTAQLYPDEATHRLNVLHAWWPAGLILGGLAGFFLGPLVSWQIIFSLTLIPAFAVVVLAAITRFPPARTAQTGVSIKEMLTEVFRRPAFLIWFGAMFLTAASELAPGQWVDIALTHRVGMRGILLLVYVSALMFLIRHVVGKLAGRLTNPGLLFVSSVLAGLGLLLLSRASSPVAALLAATLWGVGVAAMWPTMLASVAERFPRGGSWMMGLIGSAGALSVYLVLPRLGAIYDATKVEVAGGADVLAKLSGEGLLAVESAAAATSFEYVALLPAILLPVFGAIWIFERRKP